MADFKPLLLFLLVFFTIGAFLNLAVSPFVDTTTPDPDSGLAGLSDFVSNGWAVNITVPVFGTISTTFNPASWLWFGIDSIGDFVIEQLNLLTYLPDELVIPMIILFIVSISYVILTLIRGN